MARCPLRLLVEAMQDVHNIFISSQIENSISARIITKPYLRNAFTDL